jgi:hypothetical protein
MTSGSADTQKALEAPHGASVDDTERMRIKLKRYEDLGRYIISVAKTEHGMDAAVSQAARMVEMIEGPMPVFHHRK